MKQDTARRLTQAELLAEANARFGDDPKKYAFVCPNCRDEATIQDFIDAGNPTAAGQHCIGRELGVLKRDGKPVKRGRKEGIRGCDWTAYGLFGGPWTIVLPAEGDKPERTAFSFALAEATS